MRPPDFAENREMALMLGEMAVDFGTLPCDLMRLDPLDLSICIVSWREMRLAKAKRGRDMGAIPVAVV